MVDGTVKLADAARLVGAAALAGAVGTADGVDSDCCSSCGLDAGLSVVIFCSFAACAQPQQVTETSLKGPSKEGSCVRAQVRESRVFAETQLDGKLHVAEMSWRVSWNT